MSNILISKTFYNEYFDDEAKDIYLLDKTEASKLWILYVDKTANNFFRLSDNNPIISNSKSMVNWREYYDSNNITGLQNFFISTLNWNNEDSILFYINKETIIQTTYEVFLHNIFNFLELYDECPIVHNLNKSNDLEYLYFAPLGNTFFSKVEADIVNI